MFFLPLSFSITVHQKGQERKRGKETNILQAVILKGTHSNNLMLIYGKNKQLSRLPHLENGHTR